MRTLIVAFLLSACAASSPPSSTAQPAPIAGPHEVQWDRVGRNVDGIAGERDVDCTTLISHPCPFITYTRRVTLGPSFSLTWDDATGGTDGAGVSAERRAPWVDELQLDADGALVIAERGDDGGLRHEAHLAAAPDGGWGGDVEWSLFTVAGETTFHVEVLP